ncbi:unnamed protein product [Dicrocoelium dendriticum]|nr:unnamed protein product [Dicrocoelium dendriticum]
MQWLLAFAVIIQALTITSELQSQTKIQWVKIGDSVSVCCSFSLKDEELLILSNDGYRLQTMLFSEEHGIQRMEANQNEFASKKPGWMVDPLDKSSSDLCVQKETGVSIQADDGEEFVCKVIAGRGIGAVTQQGIIRVKLYVPVSIDDITDVVLVKPNETATATCYASGYPELQLFWREKTTGNVLAKSNASRSDTNELELVIPSFTPLKHGEMLECEARSGFPGDSNLAVGKTRVEFALPPNITVTSGLVHTDIGARENVQIYVTGYPTPVFHCGGLPLNSPVRVSDEPQGGTFMYEATVERITEEHLSIFECEAHNEAGTAVQPIEFTAAPSVPVILSLNTSRYADYYLLTWTANSRAPLRNVTVEIEQHPADNVPTMSTR